MNLYNAMKTIDYKHYLCSWYLYINLIETKDNLENDNFYEWECIENDIRYNDILLLWRGDKINNINNIIDIVKDIIIDEINITNGYSYVNNEIVLDWWIKEDLVMCSNCGHIWDGFAQCTCYFDD